MQLVAPVAKLVFHLGAYFVLPLFMHNTRRTRVAIINRTNSKVLLAKTLLSDQKWKLIGGGVQRGEKAVMGAVREVNEETSMAISHKDLTFVKEQKETEKNVSYVAIYYRARLKNPEPQRTGFEILDLGWFKLNELPDDTDEYTRAFLEQLQG